MVEDRSVGCGTTGVPAVGMHRAFNPQNDAGVGVSVPDGVGGSRRRGASSVDEPGRLLRRVRYAAGRVPRRRPGGLDGGAGVEIGSEVSEEHLFNLLGMCADPITGQPLGRPPVPSSAANRTPVAGFDLTFSPSKSISTAWALADADTKARISACHRRAIDVVLTYAEREVFHSRSGKNGVVQEDVEGVVAAAFTHFDSRAGDPQLHDHVVVSNRARSVSDREWRTLDSRRSVQERGHARRAAPRHAGRPVDQRVGVGLGRTVTAPFRPDPVGGHRGS